MEGSNQSSEAGSRLMEVVAYEEIGIAIYNPASLPSIPEGCILVLDGVRIGGDCCEDFLIF